jgi:hypothetical protein
MNTLLVAILFTVSVLCLAFYIYDNWSHGWDLDLPTLFGMVCIAIFPVINVGMVIYMIVTAKWGKVILKGRGR